MDHFYIKNVVLPNPAIRLLKLDNAPLIISFLDQEFKSTNRIDIPNSELVQKLSDYLYYLHENNEEGLYPDTAQVTWTNGPPMACCANIIRPTAMNRCSS